MIKFGFIGCGKVSHFHADVIVSLDHRISSVSARHGSKNIEYFAKTYNISSLYFDWQEMVKKEQLDALIIAITWNETGKIIEDVIKSGIPCLVEKPIALDSLTLQEIINNTKQFHDRVMVGYNRRFYEFIPIIKQSLEEKKLLSIELFFPEPLKNLIKQKSQQIAKYILIYMTSHWLDLLMFLIGDIKVEWMEKRLNKNSDCVESYNGILKSIRYSVPIHLQANFDAPSNTGIIFNFIDSIYKLSPIEILTIYRGMDIINPGPDNPIRKFIPKIENIICVDATYKPGFLNQMKYFIDSLVLKNKTNTLGCTLNDALKVTRLCEEIENTSINFYHNIN